ncbi:MAG: YfhO family protein [Balneolales bacterium]
MAKKPTRRKHKKAAPAEQITDYWTNLPLRTRHIICLVFLFVLPIILFTDTIIGDQRFMGHDTIQWRASAESVMEHRETYGEDALWSTHMFSGMPAYLIYYAKAVPHLNSFIFFNFTDIFPAMPYWVMLSGSYFFFILMGLRPLAAAIGAALIGFTTYFPIIIGAGHNSKVYALSLVPWLVVGYWLITRRNIWIIGLFAFALALNLEFRANHPQITYYFAFFFMIWWLYDTWNAYKQNGFPTWIKRSFVLLGAVLIAVACNVQPYWSYIEYSPHSIRGGSEIGGETGLDTGYAMAWSQGSGELLTLLIPEVYGGSSAEGTYWGPKSFTSGPHYFGAIGFLLFIFGLFKSPHRIRFLFLGSGILAILFALGEHFWALNNFMFNYFPYFDKFRAPETWLVVTTFSFAIIAAMGADSLLKYAFEKAHSLKSLYKPLGIVVGIGLVFLIAGNVLLSFEKEGEVQQITNQIAQQQNVSPANPQVQQRASQYVEEQIKPERQDKARSDTMRYLVFVLIGGGLVVATWQKKIPASYAGLGLFVLVAADLITVGNRYINEDAKMPKAVEREQIIEQQRRPLDTFIQEGVQTNEGYEYRVFPLIDNAFSNAIPNYFYPSIGGYTGVKLSRYQDLIDYAIFQGPEGLNLPVMSMLNVKYISAGQPYDLSGYSTAYQGEDGYVLENENVLPKAFFVDSLAYAATPQEAMDAINEPGFDPSSYAVLETDQRFNVGTDPDAEVNVTHYDARRITMETQRDTDGFLVLSEVYYPDGWQAFIDGEEVDIITTNFILRGIAVPAGDHEIHLEFTPRSHFVGSQISWVANLLLIAIGIAGFGLYFFGRYKD